MRKKIVINSTLIFLLAGLVIVVVAPLVADMQFNIAQKREGSYRWRMAETKYRLAVKLDPFNTSYLTKCGNFLAQQSAYRIDTFLLLKEAEELYERALWLNPGNARYAVRLGEIQIEIFRNIVKMGENKLKLNGKNSDGVETTKNTVEMSGNEIAEAMQNFRRALENDPNGFNTSYLIGYAGMSAWDFLNGDEREEVLTCLKHTIKEKHWYREYIYPQIWNSAKDFKSLQYVTPNNLHANSYLYYFIRKNELWQFRKEQADIVNFYRQKEELDKFEQKRQEKLERITKIKQRMNYKIQVANVALQKDWQGINESGKSTYKNGKMYWTGTVDALIDIPKGEGVLKIQAKGEPAYGVWPYMIIEVDGEEIGEVFVDSVEWKEYSFVVRTNGGVKVLSVTFPNDNGDWKKGIDRNLYIGKAWVVKDVE